MSQYILKRPWQTKTGLQEELYLGYNENNKIDCVAEKDKAIKMTKEECEDWLLIITDRRMWSIEEVVEEVIEIPEENQTVEENTDEQQCD